MIAFVGGFFLDLIMGDPYNFPHPVRWIGRLISAIEKHDLGEEDTKALSGEQKRRCGRRLVLLVCGTTILVTAFVLLLAYGIPSYGRMSGGNVFDLSDIGTPLSLQGEQKSIYMPAG